MQRRDRFQVRENTLLVSTIWKAEESGVVLGFRSRNIWIYQRHTDTKGPTRRLEKNGHTLLSAEMNGKMPRPRALKEPPVFLGFFTGPRGLG